MRDLFKGTTKPTIIFPTRLMIFFEFLRLFSASISYFIEKITRYRMSILVHCDDTACDKKQSIIVCIKLILYSLHISFLDLVSRFSIMVRTSLSLQRCLASCIFQSCTFKNDLCLSSTISGYKGFFTASMFLSRMSALLSLALNLQLRLRIASKPSVFLGY